MYVPITITILVSKYVPMYVNVCMYLCKTNK